MQALKLFLTFDHELPLGGLHGSYDRALFMPTYKVLKLAEELQVPVTLFTDVLGAMRYKDWDYQSFYLPYLEQLKDALRGGHDVQLHLHPHWLTSRYEHGTFIPSIDYRLADFKQHPYPNNIAGIIERGCNFLKEVCCDVDPNYQCIAYRAGGFNLSPCSGEIFAGLYNNGIRFDSSIGKKYYFRSAISEVDYTNVPSEANWFISNNGNFHIGSDAGIFEIPIATKPKGLFEMPTRFKMEKYRHRAPQHIGNRIHEGKPPAFIYKVKQALSSRLLTFDNYTNSPAYLMKILDYHIHKHASSEIILVSTIGHPKSMGDYSLMLMKRFVEQTRQKYKDRVQFYTYRQLLGEMNEMIK